jgi:hypothetical protein
MTRSPDAILDQAVAQARALRLDDAVVRARADECVRWAASTERTQRWHSWRWPAAAFALAAAAVIVAIVLPRATQTDPIAGAPIVGIGPRVAIVTSPGAVYTIRASTVDSTDIVIASGTVTARLYHSPGPGTGPGNAPDRAPGNGFDQAPSNDADHAPYRLRLIAGALEATATGTIYTVVVRPGEPPYAIVHDGQVRVRDRAGDHTISTGQSWPRRSSSAAIDAAAHRLAQHTLDAPSAPSSPGGPGSTGEPSGSAASSGSDASGSAAATGSDASTSSAGRDANRPARDPSQGAPPASGTGSASVPTGPSVPGTSEDRWRRARQLRGQGHAREALDLLDELAARNDAVWSPIALAEAMRIHASVLADPHAVVRLAKQFLDRYPGHALVREVTDMMCRAHRALGEADVPSACAVRGVE